MRDFSIARLGKVLFSPVRSQRQAAFNGRPLPKFTSYHEFFRGASPARRAVPAGVVALVRRASQLSPAVRPRHRRRSALTPAAVPFWTVAPPLGSSCEAGRTTE